ncbi:MAG: metallophosphoesterase [bacterium]|nr:metallophosphoesterase [bacterium]
MTRYIAITDIHGEVYKLKNLISKIEFLPDDTIVFMGDYIDRGYFSKEVIDYVIELGKRYNCVYLIGSHEYAYLHSRKKEEYYEYLFWNYGGDATVDSYGSYENIYKIHGDFLENLKFYYLTDKYLFVHAGINPNYSLEKQEEEDLVYIRWNIIKSKHKLPQKVIFGHTDLDKPYIDDDKIGIDLGCGKYPDAKLCALILDNGKEEFVFSD